MARRAGWPGGSLRAAGILLLALSLFACRGDGGGNGSAGFIAVHETAREALAAYEVKDAERLDRAIIRLGEISARPELFASRQLIQRVKLSRGGRYLVLVFGQSLGGSRILLLDARTGRILLGLRGYGESFSSDDRWLACLQHRYATPQPGADVGAYEALMLVDLGRVRGASLDDTRVFRTIVQDPDARFMGGKTEFIADDRIEISREKPPIEVVYSLEGEVIEKQGRRWKFLKLF